MSITLSIIIPAHNEAERLPAVLKDYARYFADRMGDAFELVVVANHCNDKTAEIARQIADDYPQIKVIEEESRIGKGGAVIMGAKAARGGWIGFVDADGATDPSEFARLFGVAQKSDGVIGSRWLPSAKVVIHQKWMRQFSSRVFNLFIRLLLGLNYQDTQCGAKIFKADAWRKILPSIGITRFAFDVDLLFQLRRERFRIIEEPTEWHDVAGSKVNVFSSSLDMFLAIIRMRLLHSPLKPLVAIYDRTLARPVEFLRTDPLFRHTLLISSAGIVVHICNMLFQLIVGRSLPKEEYALMATFLALFAIIARPAGTVATAIGHFTSILVQDNQLNLLGRLLRKWGLLTALPSVLASVACIALSPRIAAFMHLDRVEPVIVAALALPALCISPVFSGAIAGMQRFLTSSVAGTAEAITRVIVTVVLIHFVAPAAGWALLGHVSGLYATLLIIFVFLWPVLRRASTTTDRLPSMRRYLAYTFLVQLAGGILLTGDIVLVRRYLPEDSTFAYAATISRITVFLAAGVAAAMFPKVSSDKGFRPEDRDVYLRAMAYSGFFVLCAVLVCLLIPGPLLRLFYCMASVEQELLNITRIMTVVMACATFLSVNMTFLLAQRRFKILMLIVTCAVGYIGIVHIWHPSAYAIVLAAGAANLIALVGTTIGILRTPSAL